MAGIWPIAGILPSADANSAGRISAMIGFLATGAFPRFEPSSGRMLLYRTLHLLKFIGVMLLAGGTVGSFVASEPSARKRAVHGLASPGLLLTWLAGYSLSLML